MGDTASQNLDHVIAVATRYIEAHLGQEPLSWEQVRNHLKASGYADHATQALTLAVLDLERTETLTYSVAGLRTPQPNDAGPTSLMEVAAAVMLLPWPCTRNNRPAGGRSIYEAFEELGGPYRHCDVYEAMHSLLKGRELRSGYVYWQRTELPSRFDQAGRFALRADVEAAQPPDSPACRHLEADLVAAYVATLPQHSYRREHHVGDGRFADVYEPKARRIVEAKAATDVVTVAHAWAQATAYGYLANLLATDDRSTVDTIAVLLPVRPTGAAQGFLAHAAADAYEVEVIYPHGEEFRENGGPAAAQQFERTRHRPASSGLSPNPISDHSEELTDQ